MEAAFSLNHLNKEGKNIENNNHSGFPTTAYEYLKRVQHEAANCPDIVVANMDCSVFKGNQDENYTPVEPIRTLSDINGPSAIWQNEQVSTFAEIRQCLAHHKQLFVKKTFARRKLPDLQNAEHWFKFCFGQPKQGTFASEGEIQENGCPALLSIICQMNQATVLKLLEHNISWMESREFTMEQGQWIYALLVAVEKPLLPDTTYTLRSLARLCSKQQDHLNPDARNEMAALYLIITIIMIYFGQSDLAEPLRQS